MSERFINHAAGGLVGSLQGRRARSGNLRPGCHTTSSTLTLVVCDCRHQGVGGLVFVVEAH